MKATFLYTWIMLPMVQSAHATARTATNLFTQKILKLSVRESGKNLINKLNSGLYKDCKAKIIDLGNITTIPNAEIEDIIPYKYLEKGINHLFNDLEDDDFERDPNLSIIPQIESFASSHSMILPDGWKVELAKKAKRSILARETSESDLEKCATLFASFI